MKRADGWILRTVCGEKVLVGEGLEALGAGRMLSLNGTAAWLWDEAGAQGEFTAESLAEALCEAYQVDPETARNDVENLLTQWIKLGLIA